MEMEAPNGRPVEVAAVDLALDRTDAVLTEARFTFTVSPGDYARLLRESLFQLSPENRGPLAAGFVADGDVQVEARLEDSLLPRSPCSAMTSSRLGRPSPDSRVARRCGRPKAGAPFR